MQITLDNKLYTNIDGNYTIFQFCAKQGLNLPCFCYNEKLSIAGNCRMCLVQTNFMVPLVMACAMPLANNMQI